MREHGKVFTYSRSLSHYSQGKIENGDLPFLWGTLEGGKRLMLLIFLSFGLGWGEREKTHKPDAKFNESLFSVGASTA